MKILIPIDGSANANRAVDYVIAGTSNQKVLPEIALINVQWKLASGNVKLFIDQETINAYYREQGAAALAQARALLDAAGLAYRVHISIGSPAEAIVQYVQENEIEQIVMSAHGEESLATFLLGSVASKVVQLSPISVTLVK
jgi:nucleotide-binding universal stress UspA family protein